MIRMEIRSKYLYIWQINSSREKSINSSGRTRDFTLFDNKDVRCKMRYSIVVIVMCWLIGCVGVEYDEDWPTYMHDVQHTGYSPSRILTPLKELWRHEKYGIDELEIPFDPDYKGSYTRFVISDEKILVLLHPSMIFSLDIKSGSLLWSV